MAISIVLDLVKYTIIIFNGISQEKIKVNFYFGPKDFVDSEDLLMRSKRLAALAGI